MSKVSVTIEGATWGEVVDHMAAYISDYETRGIMAEHNLGAVAEELQRQQYANDAKDNPFKPFSPAAESWPVGDCPKHKKPWKAGQFGPYCTARDDTGPKGYCVLKPGDIWNGKNIPLVAA